MAWLNPIQKGLRNLNKFHAQAFWMKCKNMSSVSQECKFESIIVTKPKEYVTQVQLNRPEKRNSMNLAFWREMIDCFKMIAGDAECRAVVLTGAGSLFTSGIDLKDFGALLMQQETTDPGRLAFKISKFVGEFQETFTVIEKCPKPVIAAVHNACIGGGVDMISACDIRYCTQDAWFQIKEVDLGLAADVGTLQRFPKIVGNDSLVRELVYTARKFVADEAKAMGFVSRIFKDKDMMLEAALDLATTIAEKSPVAVQGSKTSLVYSRDHSVEEGLKHIALWNQTMLQSEDMMKAVQALMNKEKPVFSKL